MRILKILGLLTVLAAACDVDRNDPAPADIIFTGGGVYTLDTDRPWAEAVAIRGNRIIAVFDDAAEAEPFIGAATRVIGLNGRMLVPGFVDGHTHFARAGALLLDANLLRVSTPEDLRSEIARVSEILAPGEWMTGGLWGAYENWAEGSAGPSGTGESGRFRPDRSIIDSVSKDNPVFVKSFDDALYLANTPALRASGLLDAPVDGMALDDQGKPTGLIFAGSPAVERLRSTVKPKSRERLLAENRAALDVLARSGITEIHDITDDQQMRRFAMLEEAGDLSVRVWMRADLSRAAEFNERGIKMGTHPVTGARDRRLRWGAYKGYIDGIMGNHTALFFEPYDDQPDNYGRYRHHTSDDADRLIPNMDKMYRYLEEARNGGFVANVHAIGTKGTALMLDTYERLMEAAGQELEGYRVIHAQVIREQDFPRFRDLGVYAEVNPFHLSDDMRWMEERIGRERSRGAYAFRSLIENGAELIFGSDWPGTQAAYYQVHPKYLIHAAVNRTTVSGTPEGGWFPEQKISVAESLRAYTLNGARAAFDGDLRGSIAPGKLADLVILDRNLFEIPADSILKTEVDLTMVDGQIVFERQRE